MAHQYKSKCLSCGHEWNYTKKDLTQSNQNHRANELKRALRDGATVLGKNKFSDTIDNISELPEIAHQCPSCGSKNVSLETIKDSASIESNNKMIKFIIICSVALISILAISICATVLIYKNMNASAEMDITNVSTITPTSEEQMSTDVSLEEPKTDVCIIGSDKETVRKIFDGYKEKTSIMGENAIDFDNDNLLVTVFFTNEKADGVIFLSNNLNDMNATTGEGSYVSQHYDELVKMATNDTSVKIESDLTKFNSQGNKKVASELYIGNTPYDENGNTETPVSSPAPEPTQSSYTSSDKTEESEFSHCLETGLVAGVKIYLQPNNESYVGTITAFNDEIYDERGKKTKGVYLSGGAKDGWYKRSEIRYCYVRKDDPNLPSYRLID